VSTFPPQGGSGYHLCQSKKLIKSEKIRQKTFIFLKIPINYNKSTMQAGTKSSSLKINFLGGFL